MSNAPKPTTIKLEDSIKNRIKHIAEARNRAPHWIMHEAIVQYVNREEKKEELRKASILAWETFEATGAHISAKQADVWLENLENGIESEIPKCQD